MAEKRLKKNISFSPDEKDIHDFLCKQPNASSLIKELVLQYMIDTGYYKSYSDRITKNRNKKNEKDTQVLEKLYEILEIIDVDKK